MTPSCKQAYRVTATFLASLLLLSPAPGVAQSLGDVARQERERREKLKQHAARVLTNEDLAKPQILNPLDRVGLQFAASQPEAVPPDLALEMTVSEPVSAESVGFGLPTNVNLGDVARYYRLKKLLGEDALASRLRHTNVIQEAAVPPALEPLPMTTAVSIPSDDTSSIGPGTPPGVVLGDVAGTYRLDKGVRASSGARTVHPGLAPDLTANRLLSTPPVPAGTVVAPTLSMTRPSLPEATARPVASAALTGPGIPPDVSLGDVARQLRQQQAASWMSQPEAAPVPAEGISSARVIEERRTPATPAVPDEVPLAPSATMKEPRIPSALRVFSAPAPATRAQATRSQRLLRVVKLSERDVLTPVTLVVVEPGDSLWRIAARYLGEGRRWKELHAQNPEIRNPNLIHIGDVLRVPYETLAERRREFNVLHVRAGDTLWGLATAQFGRGEAWGCIARANPQLRDPNLILAGQELALPESCSEAL